MKRTRLAVGVLAAAVVAGLFVLPSRPVTEADLNAVGMTAEWEDRLYPNWVPLWVMNRFPRSPEAVFVCPSGDEWSPEAVTLIGRLPGLRAVDLSGTPAGDADVRRLLAARGGLKAVFADDTNVTDAVLPVLDAAGLRRASADSGGVSDGALLAAAAGAPRRWDASLVRRAARRFAGGQEDKNIRWPESAEAIWSGVEETDAGRRRASAGYSGLGPPTASLSWSSAGSGPGYAALPAGAWRMLSATQELGGLSLYNIAAPPGGPAGGRSVGLFLMDDCDAGWLRAGRFASHVRLWSWRHGDAPLAGRKFPHALELMVLAAEDAETPLTGAFLDAVDLPRCDTVTIIGNGRGGPVTLTKADGRFDGVRLESVPLDGASLRRLTAGGTSLHLRDLPHVTDAALAEAIDGCEGLFELEGGIDFGPRSLRAAWRPGNDLLIDERTLPPAAVVRAFLAEAGGGPVDRAITVMTGETPGEAAALLIETEGVSHDVIR